MLSPIFNVPTKVYSSEGLIKAEPSLLALGKHAMIVTGRSSAEKCGALGDVTEALDSLGIAYTHFNRITENPPIAVCFEGGELAKAVGADFVIAIGGGSPIDGGKAIAAFAANSASSPADLFDAAIISSPSLPLIAIPTTAGTGSEVNPYAVMTLEDGLRKKTFKTQYSYPVTALLDPKYTYSLDGKYTLSTALDALSHSIESFLSPKADIFSEAVALSAADTITSVIFKDKRVHRGEYTKEERSCLLRASCLAGMAIAHTGTGFPHPLGYSITLSEGVPHGSACAVFESAYLQYNELDPVGLSKLKRLYGYIGIGSDELKSLLAEAADVHLKLTPNQIREHIDRIEKAGNFANSPYVLTKGEMLDIYGRLFL